MMMNFPVYQRRLSEAKAKPERSPERAGKLLDYLQKRNRGLDFTRHSHVDMDPDKGDHFALKAHKNKVATKKLNPRKLIATQGHVRNRPVHDYLHGHGWTANQPVTVLKHKGKHYIMNGHHRVMAARLLRKKHIDADIHESMILVEESALQQLDEAQKKEDVNSFLDHLEDLIIRDGKEGFDTVQKVMTNCVNLLKGRKTEKFAISTKIDGSPALILGHDVKDGRFFVGTKSYFSKNPKINYSEDDIKLNHPNQKGLQKKLKLAMQHLPNVVPKTGVYQGDFLYSKQDLQDRGDGYHHFQPNAITYSIPQDSEEGEKIGQSKIGFAPHTEYKDVGDGNMEAQFNNPGKKFGKHADVYIMDTSAKGPFKLSADEERRIHDCMQKAKEFHKALTKINGYHLIKDHEALLLGYINDAVRKRISISGPGYMAFVQGRMKGKTDALKMGKKNAVKDTLDSSMQGLVGSKEVINNLFQMHKAIAKAKDIVIDELSKGTEFSHHINGEPSKAEGFVVKCDKRMVKLVDRDHFSSANMEWNSKVNPEDNPLVMSWGRMNPAHAGHEQMINKGAELAQQMGAKHQVVTTRSKDKKNNPLDPENKLKWLKQLFPGKNIVMADKNASTITAQLQHLNNSGVRDLTLVVGDDRIADFQKLISKYNGPGKDKLFNFTRIRVVSAGSRDPNAKGVKGASGTKMRDAAKKGDLKSFSSHLPKTHKIDAKKYMDEVKGGME